MTSSFYVSPDQLMRDRAEYARKGIVKGRAVIVVSFADGILMVGDNPSGTLHKLSEIYDRIGFAAVGRYNEFENLRVAGIRYADLHGYTYNRRDVRARGLTNAYSKLLGHAFSSATEKPFEVEIVVAEVGDNVDDDRIYHVNFDGSVTDRNRIAVIGHDADKIASQLQSLAADADYEQTLQACRESLGEDASLEIAVLQRHSEKTRRFRRIVVAND